MKTFFKYVVRTFGFLVLGSILVASSLYITQDSKQEPDRLILRHMEIADYHTKRQTVKKIENAYANWATVVATYEEANKEKLFPYKGKDKRVSDAVATYNESKEALVKFSTDAPPAEEEKSFSLDIKLMNIFSAKNRWYYGDTELSNKLAEIEEEGKALFSVIETKGTELINISALVIEEERKAEEERKRREEEERRRRFGGGGGSASLHEKMRQALAGLPFHVPYAFSNMASCAGHYDWIGCYFVGTGQILIKESWANWARICSIRSTLAHEYRHWWQDRNGLIEVDRNGNVVNRNWLEQDANSFGRRYGC